LTAAPEPEKIAGMPGLPSATLPGPRAASPGDEVSAFCERVARDPGFRRSEPVFVTRAPGRFDVLGGIADYSGSLVMGLPAAAAALGAAQSTNDGRVEARSSGRAISMPVDELAGLPLESLARRLSGRDAWAAYVLGPVALLMRQPPARHVGMRLVISSAVPEGKGLASSAAVGIAALQAAAACLGASVPPERLALLPQQAENMLAGAPCGPMDQTISALGEAGRLLAVLCRPAEVVGSLTLPDGLEVWGIDSGTARAVSGAHYRRVRCAAFAGKALLGHEGHLAAADPAELDLDALPERLGGRDLLALGIALDDPFSVVEPAVSYPVRAATLHPIEEHRRARLFAETIARPFTDERARMLGELMYESNASYRRCGIATERTEAIVAAVRRVGWEGGLVGARLSGGGGGGTVVVLGHRDAGPLVARLARKLGDGYAGGTSPGAVSFGIRIVIPTSNRRRALGSHGRATRRRPWGRPTGR
jgi:L-arabinokinase